MSYTEYLRRKAAAAPKIVDTTIRTDASTLTMRRRLAANYEFAVEARQGVINNNADPSQTGTTSASKATQKTTKLSGGRVPDASLFTSFVGGTALNNDGGPLVKPQRYVLNSNDAGSLSGCRTINEPRPSTVPKDASFVARTAMACRYGSTEPHIQNEVGPALFVDTTSTVKNYNLPQNKTKFQISQDCLQCGNNKTIGGTTCAFCIGAIHTHPADVPHNTRWAPRPRDGMGGIPVFTVPSPSDARKVGDRNPRNIPYVEKHHGNDLKVNPRRVPTDFVPTNAAPAHLKINDPRNYPVA
jgi:hypothetical protein